MTKKMTSNTTPIKEADILQQIADSVLQGRSLTGENGVMTQLLKMALERSMTGELNAHMIENKLENPQNRKNGKTAKQVHSQFGDFELETPRDRNNIFEPQIIKKRQTQLHPEIDAKILKLYSHGMGYEEIGDTIKEIYGMDISPATISAITDQLLPQIAEWKSRPLATIYPIIFFDAMFFKVRENGVVQQKAMYNILGINTAGQKEILGFYFADNEGAGFWRAVLNDLINRGVKDILIACVDGLKGFSDAIHSAYPACEVQPCIVHAIRRTLSFLPYKDKKAFIEDLKKVYKANDKDTAIIALSELNLKWKKYALALKYWNENWDNLSNYFKFTHQIRRLIYTTNAIEGFHRQLRKYTKTKGAFTSEMALQKISFCAIQNIVQKWTMPIQHWHDIIAELDAFFPNRIILG